MDIVTLGVLLAIALAAAVIGRALGGYTLSGCLITYLLACLGAIGGWVIQQLFFWPDRLLTLPVSGASTSVSIIGASAGALLLAFLGGLLGRPVPPRRPRRR
jgi:hypothetical protein